MDVFMLSRDRQCA